jgi:hypothetical protein
MFLVTAIDLLAATTLLENLKNAARLDLINNSNSRDAFARLLFYMTVRHKMSPAWYGSTSYQSAAWRAAAVKCATNAKLQFLIYKSEILIATNERIGKRTQNLTPLRHKSIERQRLDYCNAYSEMDARTKNLPNRKRRS